MSYKYSRGYQIIGDLSGSDDPERNTGIDFEDDEINIVTSGSTRLQISNDGVYIPDSPQNASLFVSGGVEITPGNQEGLRFMKSSNELNFISFQDGNGGGSYNARLSYNSTEYLFIAPGRGGDFFINSGESSGGFTFPFSIMDDGTAKFTKGLSDSTERATDLDSSIAFYVSGTTDGNNNAVFVGNVVMSGSLNVGQQVSTNALSVKVRDVGATGAVEETDYILRCIQTANITITLPPKNESVGRVLIFKDAEANAGSPNNNTITIDGNGSDTIDGSATYVISHNREGVHFICDGINGWMMTSRVKP